MPGDKNTYLKVRLGSAKPFADLSPQVISVDILDEDRGTDKATVLLADQAHVNAEAIRVGQEVRIEMGWESEHALLFMGEIRKTEAVAPAGGSTVGRVSFVAYDFSYRMGTRPKPELRSYEGSLDAILTVLAKRAGIPRATVTMDVIPSWPINGLRLEQRDRTDWQMVQDLAEDYRARAFVEVNSEASDSAEELDQGGASRLYFISEKALLAQKPFGTLNYCRGYSSLIEFKFSRIGAGASPSASVVVQDAATGVVTRETAPPHPAEAPSALGANQSEGTEAAMGQSRAASAGVAVDFANSQPAPPTPTRPVTEIAGAPSDPAKARGLIEQDATRIAGLSGSGLSMGTVLLRAKGSVQIEGLASAASGQWYLRSVNHRFEKEDTGKAARQTYRTSFEATR